MQTKSEPDKIKIKGHTGKVVHYGTATNEYAICGQRIPPRGYWVRVYSEVNCPSCIQKNK